MWGEERGLDGQIIIDFLSSTIRATQETYLMLSWAEHISNHCAGAGDFIQVPNTTTLGTFNFLNNAVW